MEQSDSINLGTLAHFSHFRHFKNHKGFTLIFCLVTNQVQNRFGPAAAFAIVQPLYRGSGAFAADDIIKPEEEFACKMGMLVGFYSEPVMQHIRSVPGAHGYTTGTIIPSFGV